eukprot:9773922-Prorocentrum_lima.AAC.1
MTTTAPSIARQTRQHWCEFYGETRIPAPEGRPSRATHRTASNEMTTIAATAASEQKNPPQ